MDWKVKIFTTNDEGILTIEQDINTFLEEEGKLRDVTSSISTAQSREQPNRSRSRFYTVIITYRL